MLQSIVDGIIRLKENNFANDLYLKGRDNMALTLLLIIIYASFISLGLPDSMLGSAWPYIYGKLSVPISYAGIISMIIASGTIISSIFSDRVIKYFGTGIVTAVSVLMTAVALLGFSFSHSFILLCLWSIPLGLGAGSVDAALNNYVALHYKANHMNWLHCFWGIGVTVGPIIMSSCLIGLGSWNTGYKITAIIQFLLTAILFLSLPLWKKVCKDDKDKSEGNITTLRFSEILRLPGAKFALIAFFCYYAIEQTIALWGSSYLVIEKGVSPEFATQWIFLYFLGITLGRVISGFLTMKFSSEKMIRLGEIFIASGIVVLLLPLKIELVLFGFFIIGIGCAPIYPSLLHETPTNFGSEYSQSVMGVQMGCAYIGSTFAPPLFGLIASNISCKLFIFYIGLLLIFMIVMVEKLHDKHAVKKIECEI